MNWKFTDPLNEVAFRVRDDGRTESCLASALPEGTQIESSDQPTHNELILKQITELEAKQTPRRLREGGAWLADLDAQIAALRTGFQK